MRLFLILLLLAVQIESIAQKANEPAGLDAFLSGAAVGSKHEDIRDFIGFFLNRKFNKNTITWLKGSIETTSGVTYHDLELKFNTISNSIYLKHENKLYKVFSREIEGFTITDQGQKRVFEKGYSIPHSNVIRAQFGLRNFELLKYIAAYKKIEELHINFLNSDEDKGTLTIEISSAKKEKVRELRQYLIANASIWDIKIESASPDVNANTYFEILLQNETFKLLKHNYKKTGQTESISLVKHSETHIFDDKNYYVANKYDEIQEVIFLRKSVRDGLDFLEIEEPKKIPTIMNERKLVEWFSETF